MPVTKSTATGPFAAHTDPRHRVILSGHGETKTGKSSFYLWGPDPVLAFDLDRRLERVIERFRDGTATNGSPRVVEAVPLKLPPPPNERFFTVSKDLRDKDERERKEAERLWNLFVTNYRHALDGTLKAPNGKRFRTIGVDTLTELQELRLLAEFGRLIGFRQRERGGANSDIVELIRMAEDYDVNVVWLHQMKDEYARTKKQQKNAATGEMETVEDSDRTGKRVIKGYDKTPYITQAHLVFGIEERKGKPQRFTVEVERCGVNADMNRRVYTAEDWTVEDGEGGYAVNFGPFAKVAADMTGTGVEEWLGGEENE